MVSRPDHRRHAVSSSEVVDSPAATLLFTSVTLRSSFAFSAASHDLPTLWNRHFRKFKKHSEIMVGGSAWVIAAVTLLLSNAVEKFIAHHLAAHAFTWRVLARWSAQNLSQT